MEDHRIIANAPDFGNVTVCPGGVVHINLPHMSLKFVPSDFVKLADLIAQAHRNFQATSGPGPAKPHLHVVTTPKAKELPSSDSTETT
ncbi:MAG: hypothetical protein V2B18_14295 [Pseudomonadota bacterium]